MTSPVPHVILRLPPSIRLREMVHSPNRTKEEAIESMISIWGDRLSVPPGFLNPEGIELLDIPRKSVTRHVDYEVVATVTPGEYIFKTGDKAYPARLERLVKVDECLKETNAPYNVKNLGRIYWALVVIDLDKGESPPPSLVQGLTTLGREYQATTFEDRMKKEGVTRGQLKEATDLLEKTTQRLREHRHALKTKGTSTSITFTRKELEEIEPWMAHVNDSFTVERDDDQFRSSTVDVAGPLVKRAAQFAKDTQEANAKIKEIEVHLDALEDQYQRGALNYFGYIAQRQTLEKQAGEAQSKKIWKKEER